MSEDTQLPESAELNKADDPKDFKPLDKVNIPLLDNIPEDVEQIIEGLPEDAQEKLMGVLIKQSIRSTYRGPIPPPEILKGYNDVIPGGAERILALSEKQAEHRMQLEDFSIRDDQRQSGRGQNYGFILALVGLLISGVLAYLGHDGFAGVLGTTTIIGLVSIFVVGKKLQNKDLESK